MRVLKLIKRIKNNNDKGATIVLVSILLVVILGIAALAIDIGNLAATKGELQKLSDAAALAAAGDLGRQYADGPCAGVSQTDIANIAKDVGLKNVADTKSITLRDEDIVLGCWDFDAQDFTPLGEDDCGCDDIIPNAVSVTAHRDSEANTPVDTFFAGVLGPDTVGLRANAVAALSGPSEIDQLPIPVGISEAWYDPDNWAGEEKGYCDQNIKFYPTGDLTGCAGWHVYSEPPANAAKLSDLLTCLALPESDPDSCSPPSGTAGASFAFTGGTVASVFPEMMALFDEKKAYDPDYPGYPDGVWTVGIPVYDRDDCSNPQGDIAITGFTTAVIFEVTDAPEKTITAKVICDRTVVGHGGGGTFGTLGSIPGLVK